MSFRLIVLVLVLYAALEPALAIDTITLLAARAEIMERSNLWLLLFYEMMRVVRGVVGLLLVALLLPRAKNQPAARALILFLLFGLMAYAMALAGSAYVGPFQSWLTGSLLAAGLSRAALRVIFAYPDWALWLCLAALLRFSVLFPSVLTNDALAQSGAQDRQGLLRGVPGAGVDVGSAFRRIAGQALSRGWLSGTVVWIAGVIAATLSILLRGSALKPLLWLPFFLGLATAITCLRASYLQGDGAARVSLLWITRGALAALLCYMLSGVVGILEGAPAALAVFVLLTLTPVGLLFGIGMAVLQRNRSENVVPALS